MKVSLNWIKEYTSVDESIEVLLDKIGQQLGATEEVIDLSKVFAGTIVRVVSAELIEGTHLNLCFVDDNGLNKDVNRDANNLIQVVCGAPNVRADMLAVWLAPGETVPSTVGKEPFVLEAKELRGHVSNGMLASARELTLGDDHEGILEITEDLKPGDSFASSYGLDDFVIDIENKMFTHRPDCFGELGVAREIAGILGKQFTSPDWYLKPLDIPSTDNLVPLEVDIQIPKLVPRFTAIALSGVDGAQKSPVWLQALLTRVGIRPISLIVDVTNYMMMLTAQPLHAFDYDKVVSLSGGGSAKLVVRNPKENEQLTLLDGKTIKPGSEAIMIAAPDKLLALAGIKGGKDTEVSSETKNIIIECANFDMYSVRRAGMALGQFSDAFTRFTKGQSPIQLDRVLAKTVDMLTELAGASVASPVIDINNSGLGEYIHSPVKVSASFINSRLGSDLATSEMSKLLTNVEFKVEDSGGELTVTAPFWRSDIELPEDIVEEVGRLYGFQHLPLHLPAKDISPASLNKSLAFKTTVRSILSSGGSNELLTYSFVHENLLKAAGQDKSQAYAIANALSPDLQYYRLSLTPSLLDKVHPNIKAGDREFVLYEINPIHIKGLMDKNEPNLPAEFQRLGLVVACEDKQAKASYDGAPYYQATFYLERLLTKLEVLYRLEPLSQDLRGSSLEQALKTYEPKRSALVVVDDEIIGVVGEPTLAAKSHLKLPDFVAMFELDLDALRANAKPKKYLELSHFPKVEQDICFRVEDKVDYQSLVDLANAFIRSKFEDEMYFYISPVDIYKSDQDNQHKQITLRISINSYLKTMTDKEVFNLLEELGQEAAKKLGAVVI